MLNATVNPSPSRVIFANRLSVDTWKHTILINELRGGADVNVIVLFL